MVNIYSIEQYEALLNEDPHSKSFAPLADAYRKQKRFDEALNLCKQGLLVHPEFVGGHLSLAKIYYDQNLPKAAEKSFLKAFKYDPQNLLALTHLAQIYLELGRYSESLKFCELVKISSPDHKENQFMIKKLGQLLLQKKNDPPIKAKSQVSLTAMKHMDEDRHLSVIDALISSQSFESAQERIFLAERSMGSFPELTRRQQFLNSQYRLGSHIKISEFTPDSVIHRQKNIDLLKKLLKKVKEKDKSASLEDPAKDWCYNGVEL